MGLDMYLYSAPKIEGLKMEEIIHANNTLATLEKENNELYSKVKDYIKDFEEFGHKWKSLFTEELYWRKANHIHGWFVQHVQGGEDQNLALSRVEKDQVIELQKTCEEVLLNESKANQALPTTPGPFFGSCAYDSYYYDETKRTLDKLNFFLETPFFEENYLFYQSFW